MVVRDLTDEEFNIAYSLVLRLERLQGITDFSASVTEYIKNRMLSRAQFDRLNFNIKNPYKNTVKKLTPNVRSRKKVTLAERA